ncbi:MAG TPA: plastocyanin/azurin family copper-binding protein [Chloroflexota bacterium]|nr:plastocyanin/azurin family copper-binding protein [Chloroflexota bacterium]
MYLFVRSVGALLFSAALLCLTVLVAGAAASMPVQAGASSSDQAVQVLQYYPGTITVDVGDAVNWAVASREVHTVSFGTPPGPFGSDQNNAPAGGATYAGTGWASSGILPPGKSYSLTFTTPGTFHYACAIHPSMHGVVVVQPAGTAYPASQASYKPASDPVLVATLKAGQAAVAAQKVTSKPNGNGTTTYWMDAGFGDGKTFAVQRFGTNALTIHAGDSVVWTQTDPNEIHTVSFLDNGKDVPFTLPNGQTNPQAAAPSGGKVYSGTGFFSSGILTPANTPAPGPHTYTLTFDKPGTFAYECLLHDNLGMKGTITVLASMTPNALPSTGGVPSAAGALLGVLGLGLVAGGIGMHRRTRSNEND